MRWTSYAHRSRAAAISSRPAFPPCRGSLRSWAQKVDTRPVGPQDLADLARLFDSQRATRHCWCMTFCVTRGQFAAGWFGGGNRHRFEAMAMEDPTPMGILALVAGEPFGWCACGPRSRYVVATSGRSKVMGSRAHAEDESVWLLPCLFVRAGHEARGSRTPWCMPPSSWPADKAHSPSKAGRSRERFGSPLMPSSAARRSSKTWGFSASNGPVRNARSCDWSYPGSAMAIYR